MHRVRTYNNDIRQLLLLLVLLLYMSIRDGRGRVLKYHKPLTGRQDPYTVMFPGNMSTEEKSSEADITTAER